MTFLRNLLFGGLGAATVLGDAGLTIARVSLGLFLAFGHGFAKLPPGEQLIGGTRAMGFPMPEVAAWCAGLAESVGALLVAAGLLTRPAAAAVVFTMGVAAFKVHGSHPWFPESGSDGPSKEMAMLYLLPFLAFLFVGAGRFGLDALLRPRPRVVAVIEKA